MALFRRRRGVAPSPVLADEAPSVEAVGAEALAVEAVAVQAVAAAGVDLSRPVLLRHVLLVRDPAAAEAVAALVRAEGYDATLDTADGGYTWIVRARETALLTPAHAARARARLTGVAARHGGEYEGWVAAAP